MCTSRCPSLTRCSRHGSCRKAPRRRRRRRRRRQRSPARGDRRRFGRPLRATRLRAAAAAASRRRPERRGRGLPRPRSCAPRPRPPPRRASRRAHRGARRPRRRWCVAPPPAHSARTAVVRRCAHSLSLSLARAGGEARARRGATRRGRPDTLAARRGHRRRRRARDGGEERRRAVSGGRAVLRPAAGLLGRQREIGNSSQPSECVCRLRTQP